MNTLMIIAGVVGWVAWAAVILNLINKMDKENNDLLKMHNLQMEKLIYTNEVQKLKNQLRINKA